MGEKYGVPSKSYVPTRWLEHGDRVGFGEQVLEVLHCPGHCHGHVAYFSPAITRLMLNDYDRNMTGRSVIDRYETLSDREREIFQLLAEARTNKEVAELLSISPATVETHRARILQKLDVHSIAELVLYAVRRGVIS